jgi:hypothetical protein
LIESEKSMLVLLTLTFLLIEEIAAIWVITAITDHWKTIHWVAVGSLGIVVAWAFLTVFFIKWNADEPRFGLSEVLPKAKSKSRVVFKITLYSAVWLAVATGAAYLPKEIYLFLWQSYDGSVAGIIGALYWIIGIPVLIAVQFLIALGVLQNIPKKSKALQKANADQPSSRIL